MNRLMSSTKTVGTVVSWSSITGIANLIRVFCMSCSILAEPISTEIEPFVKVAAWVI